VTGLIDSTGTMVVEYTYNAWGKILSTTGTLATSLGQSNPFRYRGYYFDTETGLYYVTSRYYDPETCRMLNADDTEILQETQEELLGANLFAYCGNNPVMYSDSTGMWLDRLICGVVGAAVFGTLAYVVCKVVGLFVPIDKKTTAAITIAFAALGGVIGAVLGPSFMFKYAPNLLKAIQQIEKTKFSLKAIGPNTGGNVFGIVISNILIIMLHAPHPKYNEWFFHIQVEVKLGGKQFVIWKKSIWNVNPKTWGK